MFGSNEGRSWVWTEDKRAPGGRSMGGGVGGGEEQLGVGANGPPTDILQAAYVGALDSVKAMVTGGEDADSPDLIKGSTPLHWASFGGHLDVVRWLVKEAGADVNRPNKDGCTPLLFACERGHAGVAQWLVREGGAQVNVKDDVTWQTPLHRVCLNSQRRSRDPSFATEDEDFALWLVEAGADLGAVDRFGNHVEDLCAPDMESDVSLEHGTGKSESAMSRSSICDMISAARLEEETMEDAAENLKRQRAARRRSSSDMVIQLSPKLEAKHRTPGGRKPIRKGQGQGQAEPASPSSRPYRPGVVKAHPPALVRRGSGGSGGGAAAPATGAAAARMGGGPPAPSASGDDEEEANEERGLLMGTDGVVRGGGEVDQPGGASTLGHIDEMMAKFGGGKSRRGADRGHHSQPPPPDEDSRRHQQSPRATAQASESGSRRKLDQSGQQVVEKLRELSLKKASGLLSDKDFTASKRQLLEMEQLRREAEVEDRKRAQEQAEDNGVAVLTVGQNTPPPSPKLDEDTDTINSDFDVLVGHPLLPFDMGGGGKDRRETYRASDIDRYTTKSNYDAPRVFGEVPVNVKESLAAKEATSLSREESASVMVPRASVGTSSSASAAAATAPDTAASSNDTSSNVAELATSKAKPKAKQSELEMSAAGTGARGSDSDNLYDTNGDAAKNTRSHGGGIDAKGLGSFSDGDLTAGVGSNSEPAALYRSRSISSRCRRCVCVIA